MTSQPKVTVRVQIIHIPELCQSNHNEICRAESLELVKNSFEEALVAISKYNGIEPCWRYCPVGVKYE